ncbi:MAG: asparagine synthase (glutamine-hydrolyzing) [Kiritimatiellae bacterium]|jgi:asparagine synthase (glutamine-hydrolysing)|nr:asparagine synthase (glutamine-hydrolyzing) [Kiritimatiellia bacterium]
MCGLLLSIHPDEEVRHLFEPALARLTHRGPDDSGVWADPEGSCLLGHRRLSIIDLSDAGHQPFSDPEGRYHLVFNGEIYNYLELREELRSTWCFRTDTDTEVLLAAYLTWGPGCLDRFLGMFAFAIWDQRARSLFAARDRFGVKPLYYATGPDGALHMASEIKALHALGISSEPDEDTWRSYLARGVYENGAPTFYRAVRSVPAGHVLRQSAAGGGPDVLPCYSLADRLMAQGPDMRPESEVAAELLDLFHENLSLRFRADVPVGISLSGGLDSSLLLGLICQSQEGGENVQAFTFVCGDERYDETPWVSAMVEGTRIVPNYCLLCAEEIPELAVRIQATQDEPFGGFPTLGMAKAHLRARELGVKVLLDGNGLDEGWGGYGYYAEADTTAYALGPVQGTLNSGVRPDVLNPGFLEGVMPELPPPPFQDALVNLQYRDLTHTKIPRAMRFADRVSMMVSLELRQPFLDHSIHELGLRKPLNRKIRDGQGKWLPRMLANQLLPPGVALAPKRPVQSPQREWLQGCLAPWAETQIEAALSGWGADWFDAPKVRKAWRVYREQGADNSFPVWQWINLGLMCTAPSIPRPEFRYIDNLIVSKAFL